VQVTGIRVVGTRFTCLKGMLDAAALHCLSLAAPEPSDGFPVHCWGGDVVDLSKQTRKVCWGLDFRVHFECEQLLLVLTALGNDSGTAAERCLRQHPHQQ